MKRILSLDASSTTIGLSVIDYQLPKIELIHTEFYKPPKKGDIFERLYEVKHFIKEKISEFKPDETAMEDIVLFMSKNSTAKTITTLAILNRTVGLSIFEEMGKSPYLYNAMKIRHTIKQNKKLPPKEEVPELVAKLLNTNYNWLTKTYRGKEKILTENYDIADAIACGLCHIYLQKQDVKPKKSKKKTRKKK